MVMEIQLVNETCWAEKINKNQQAGPSLEIKLLTHAG